MKAVLVYLTLLSASSVFAQTRNNCFQNFRFNERIATPRTDNFSIGLFKSMAQSNPKSTFMSPYGIWSALALAYLGSNGVTKNELGSALGLGPDKELALGAMRKLRFGLTNSQSGGPILNSLDRAYFADNMQIRECILTAIPDVEKVDFSQPQQAAATINNAVNRATQGKISSIVDSNALRSARMVLLNAIYFKGEWEKTFNPEKTTKVYFTDEDRTRNISIITSMVQPKTTYKYVSPRIAPEINAEIVEIPYSGGEFSMIAMLPIPGQSTVDSVLSSLTANTMDSAISKMTPTVLNLAFPKFKLSAQYEDDLKQGVQEQNIFNLFTPSADLSDFTNSERLLVDTILHKAVLEVTEKGTTAAAATAIIATRTGGAINPTTVIFNKPFIFFIRHNPTKTTLFAGSYRNPDDIEQI